MTDQPSLFDGDVTRNKHQGNPESEAAFDRVRPNRGALQRVVLGYVARSDDGATLKEIVARSGLPIQTVSGRLAELKAASMLEKTGQRREYCAVLRITSLGKVWLHETQDSRH